MSLVNQICGSVIEVNSGVRRTEKRMKNILLPEWSSGGVNVKSFYLHCWNGPWRRFMFVLAKFFISVAVIVLGRRFSVARTGCIVSLEKNSYLLLHGICCPQNVSIFISTRAQIGIRIRWLTAYLSCTYLCCTCECCGYLSCAMVYQYQRF